MATLRAAFEFPPTAAAPGMARRVVREMVQAWSMDPQLVPDAELLVTEVVANAVEHAGSESALELDLTASDDWLRVGLADGSMIRPVIRELDHTALRGRGMQLVAAVADRWGSEDHRGGKRVWFDLNAASVHH